MHTAFKSLAATCPPLGDSICHNIPRTQGIRDKQREREKKVFDQYIIPNNTGNTSVYLYNFLFIICHFVTDYACSSCITLPCSAWPSFFFLCIFTEMPILEARVSIDGVLINIMVLQILVWQDLTFVIGMSFLLVNGSTNFLLDLVKFYFLALLY